MFQSIIINSIRTTLCLLAMLALGMQIAHGDEDPMSPMYEMDLGEHKVDLSKNLLAGKFLRYGYHSFWEVNKDRGPRGAPAAMVHDIVFYENGECEWTALDIFVGEHARSPCGTVEIAPNIYQVSWLEVETRQVVVLTINLNTWMVNSTFHFNSGKGLALWKGTVYAFGEYPEPPVSQRSN